MVSSFLVYRSNYFYYYYYYYYYNYYSFVKIIANSVLSEAVTRNLANRSFRFALIQGVMRRRHPRCIKPP